MSQELDVETPKLSMPRRQFLKLAAAGGAALALSSVKLDALAAKMGNKTPECLHCGQNHAAGKCIDPKTNKMSGKSCAIPDYNSTALIQAKEFPNLATVEGISQNQLTQHLGLYQAYVKKINEITASINSAVIDPSLMNGTYSPFRELHVEQTFALNGVVLHEYYFENIGGAKTAPTDLVKSTFTKEFGSWDSYINHLNALGKSARGWVVTGYNMRDHRIHNYLMDAHNQLVPVHVLPLLVLDVYEHAYMVDFGTKRAPYLEAFIQNIDWAQVDQRLKMMLLHA
jgi:Fe-Mn family superoxide dismutase